MEITHTCTRCRKHKLRSDFYQANNRPGVRQPCKDCYRYLKNRAKQRKMAHARSALKKRYKRWLRQEINAIRTMIEENREIIDQLEYRAEFPIHPKLSVHRWDETHDVWHRGRLFLVDHVVVERLIRGRPVGEAGYNIAERDMAILRLNALGLQDGRIARRLGYADGNTVQNIRQSVLGVPPAEGDSQDQYRERDFW